MSHGLRVGLIVGAQVLHQDQQRLSDWGVASIGLGMPGSADGARRLKAAAEYHGVDIASARLFGNPLVNAADVRRWEQAIDEVHLLGSRLLVGFTGRLPTGTVPDNMSRLQEVWQPLLQRAADCGVRIAFENCSLGGDWYAPLAETMQRGRGNVAFSPDAWELIFDALPHAHLGLCWEPGHAVLSLADPMSQLRRFVQRVFIVEGKDASIDWSIIREIGIDGRHARRGSQTYANWAFPGQGDSNWQQIIRLLVRHDFKGAILIEGHHDVVLRDAYEWSGRLDAVRFLQRCIGHPAVEVGT